MDFGLKLAFLSVFLQLLFFDGLLKFELFPVESEEPFLFFNEVNHFLIYIYPSIFWFILKQSCQVQTILAK